MTREKNIEELTKDRVRESHIKKEMFNLLDSMNTQLNDFNNPTEEKKQDLVKLIEEQKIYYQSILAHFKKYNINRSEIAHSL